MKKYMYDVIARIKKLNKSSLKYIGVSREGWPCYEVAYKGPYKEACRLLKTTWPALFKGCNLALNDYGVWVYDQWGDCWWYDYTTLMRRS